MVFAAAFWNKDDYIFKIDFESCGLVQSLIQSWEKEKMEIGRNFETIAFIIIHIILSFILRTIHSMSVFALTYSRVSKHSSCAVVSPSNVCTVQLHKLLKPAPTAREDGTQWWRRRSELSCLRCLWVTVDDKRQTQTFFSGTQIPDACFCLVLYWFFFCLFCRIKEKSESPKNQKQEFVHCNCERISRVSTAKALS